MKTLSIPPSVRRALARHRRSIAAVATAVAVLAIITALQPERGPSVVVVTAAHPLAAGTTLTDADLTRTSMPESFVPPDALTDPAAAVGRVVNAPVSERSVVTAASVAAGQSLARPGMVVIALPLADEALAALVTPGSLIDIFGTTASGAGVIASEVRVVAAPQPKGGLASMSSGRVALVEVTPAVAGQLTVVGNAGGVTIALR